MEFVDLKTQQNRIHDTLNDNIQKVLNHGNYIMGPEVKQLETKLAAYTGTKHALSCASGTDALLMALMAYGIKPGDAIFTTPFTFIATAEVISLLGATPVFVDIDPQTFNIDPKKLALAIQAVKNNDPSLYPLPLTPDSTRLTPRGVIPVDLFGLPADYEAIAVIAKEYELFVIEDAAQSFGAQYKNKMACSFGDVGCTSFFPAKPLGCYGDGGMCFTNDDQMAEVMESIRVHGKGGHKYDNIRIGINGRLDTLQAAILLAKFDIFPEEVELRQAVAQRYTSLLTPDSLMRQGDNETQASEIEDDLQVTKCTEACRKNYTPGQNERSEVRNVSRTIPEAKRSGTLLSPHIAEGYKSAWAQYSILARDEEHRTALLKKLQGNNIPTAIYYPTPLHRQTAFAFLGYQAGSFPVSEDIAKRIFSLPMHPYLTAQEQTKIAEVIKG